MIELYQAFNTKYYRNQEVNCCYEGWLGLNLRIQAKDDGMSEGPN
jgi:hypothetical protein